MMANAVWREKRAAAGNIRGEKTPAAKHHNSVAPPTVCRNFPYLIDSAVWKHSATKQPVLFYLFC